MVVWDVEFLRALAARDRAAAGAREAGHGHGPARHQGPGRGARDLAAEAAARRTARAGRPDDPLRHRGRARRRPLPGSSCERFREFVGSVERRRRAGARRQQRRDAARPPRPTSTWCAAAWPSTGWTRSSGTRREHGLEPALALESYVAAVKRFEPGESAGYGRRWTASRADLGGDAADRLRRRLAPGADQRLRRARRRPAPSAGGHREHGQRDRGPRAPRPTWRWATSAVLIGAQGDERILCEEVAQAAGHDQLRGHLRPVARACRACTSRDRRAGRRRAGARGARGAGAAATPAWLVGGVVRDALLGRALRDVDVAVDGDAERRRPGGGGGVRRPGVPALGGVRRLAGARPRATLHLRRLRRSRARGSRTDLGLRDFTVNAMAVPIGGGAAS